MRRHVWLGGGRLGGLAVAGLLALLIAGACSDDPTQAERFDLVDPALATCESTTPVVTGEVEVERPTVDGDVVNVFYHGTLNDGEIFDSSRDRAMEFQVTVGTSGVIEGFDAALQGLQIGQTIRVCIPPAQAYGEFDRGLTFEFPVAQAPPRLEAGSSAVVDGVQATVVELTEEVVRLNANHALAGQALTFEIELLSFENAPGQPPPPAPGQAPAPAP